MNENKKVMPERFYSLDNNMSIDKIIQAQDTGDPLIGKVVLWNSKSKCLEVDLGNGYRGYIPAEYASVYPVLLPDGKVTASLRAIIGKIIVVTVVGVVPNGDILKVVLSRKDNMLKAFDIISNSIGKKIECCVSSFSSFGVFVDVGNGISGLIHYEDLCTSRVEHFSDIGLKVGDKITAKVIRVDNNFHVNLNYKDQFENLAYVLVRDDLIEATILKPINSSGYFAYLNPNTSAVVDVPENIPCSYGDKVLARVKGPRTNHPEDLRLTFVSFIE